MRLFGRKRNGAPGSPGGMYLGLRQQSSGWRETSSPGFRATRRCSPCSGHEVITQIRLSQAGW